ncbi:MAG: FAD-dependent oxidoreductase [Solirubrobacteraceae bacterium]
MASITVRPVTFRLNTRPQGAPRVVIAGGGVAGLETMIALRTLAGDRADVQLVSPEREFAYRPLTVAAAFGASLGPQLEVAELARAVGASYVTDAVTSVAPRANAATLSSGARIGYDILVLATGARPTDSIPGAITFGSPGGTRRFRALLAAAQSGAVSRIVFASTDACGWPLALYELALLSAQRLLCAGVHAQLAVMTPELAPLASFGGRASGAVLEELEGRRIQFLPGMHARELAAGELRASPGEFRMPADAVVTLPALTGPRFDGLPSDERGFIVADAHGLVHGMTDVYAAGDAISFPVKHGGLAAEQADAVAAAIAARLGAPVKPEPFAPVLRGMLLTGGDTRYMEGPLDQSGAATTSTNPLWWPPAKIAGRYIAPYLSGQITGPPASLTRVPVELEIEREPQPVGAGADESG